MRLVRLLMTLTILAACAAAGGCAARLREGVVVAKCARSLEPEVYEEVTFHCTEPSVYWVKVKGIDDKGRVRVKNIILFRHDWEALQVGDHWSRKGGFSPAEGK